MKLKSVALASALALGSLAAQAATVNLGNIGPVTVNSGDVLLAPGLFNDTFTFSLASAGTLQSNVTTFFGNIPPAQAYYSIWSTGADHMANTADDVAVPSGVFTFSSMSSSKFTSLASGSYFVNVLAVASQVPAAYAISLSAMPVPEPETYALLAAGLGVIGFVASRRRRDY